MSQDNLENKSSTHDVRTLVVPGLPKGIIDSEHGGVLCFGDRYLNGATGAEASVEVHALIVQGTFEETAFVGIAGTDAEVFFPSVFHTKDVLVFGKGVGDEVTCEGHAVHLSHMPVVCAGDAQLRGQLELVNTLDNGMLDGSTGEEGLDGQTVARELQGRSNVLQGDAEVDVVEGTSDILDASIQGHTSSRHIGD